MTTDTAVRCALGVSDRTLSDYRSDGLSAKEMERLRAHVAQCPACQARLDAFETIARTLRAQSELDGHAQLWRNVRASIVAAPAHASASRRGSHMRGEVRSHSAQLWTAFGSIAAVLALSVGFVTLFASQGGWPPFGAHVQGTRTIQSGSLTWRQVTLPVGFPDVSQSNVSATHTAATIARSDGNTAYACQADKKYMSSPTVWATHDAGAHWSVITPNDLPADTSDCRIVVDANDAKALIVSFYPVLSPQQPALPNTWTTYASFDGGTTWDKPAGLQDGNVTMIQASAHGRIYAIRGTTALNGDLNTALYVSGDQMRTWTRIDATLPRTFITSGNIDGNDRIQMWVNGGEVILETAAKQLWSTIDDGAHWTKLTLPNDSFAASNTTTFVAGGPTTSADLTICGIFTQTHLYCTSDDGKTWHETPSPVAADDSGGNLGLLDVGSDGSVYVVNSWDRSSQALAIFRLPLGATKAADWQRLGAIPHTPSICEGFCEAFPSGQEMIFWLLPSVATTDSGTIVQPNYYVATYP